MAVERVVTINVLMDVGMIVMLVAKTIAAGDVMKDVPGAQADVQLLAEGGAIRLVARAAETALAQGVVGRSAPVVLPVVLVHVIPGAVLLVSKFVLEHAVPHVQAPALVTAKARAMECKVL